MLSVESKFKFYFLEISGVFAPPKIFDLQLGESADAEPVDMESGLYNTNTITQENANKNSNAVECRQKTARITSQHHNITNKNKCNKQ